MDNFIRRIFRFGKDRNTREKELRHVEKSVGKVFMKLSANMAKEATKPELMRSGMLQTRGAFLRDRNSWRLSRVNVTNKYLQLENLEKGDSGVKRTRKFKFPHRTLKKNVRSFTRYIRITDTRYSQTNNSGRVVEFCASNRSECLEWYSIIRETIEMCVASSSVTSLLKVGNSSKQRRPDRRRSSDEDDLSIRDGANLITVTCLQNSLLRIPKCADIEQAWWGNQTTQINGRFVTDRVKEMKARFFQKQDRKGDFVMCANSKWLGDSSRDATKKLVVSYRMPKDMQVMNPQDQISRVVVKPGETTPKLKFDSLIFRARFGTEDENLDVTSRVRKIYNKTEKFEVRADALGVHPSSHLFRTHNKKDCVLTLEISNPLKCIGTDKNKTKTSKDNSLAEEQSSHQDMHIWDNTTQNVGFRIKKTDIKYCIICWLPVIVHKNARVRAIQLTMTVPSDYPKRAPEFHLHRIDRHTLRHEAVVPRSDPKMWKEACEEFSKTPYSNGHDARYETVKAKLRARYGKHAIYDGNKSRLKKIAESRGMDTLRPPLETKTGWHLNRILPSLRDWNNSKSNRPSLSHVAKKMIGILTEPRIELFADDAPLAAQYDDLNYLKELESFDLLWRCDREMHRNALHHAALLGNLPVARWLVQTAHETNTLANQLTRTDRKGWTALHCCCEGGHIAIVRLLVKAGASIHARDVKGNTPLKLAQSRKHFDIMFEMLHSGQLKLLVELLLSEQSRLHHLHLMDERVRVPMLAMVESQENKSDKDDVRASDIEELFYHFSETCEHVYTFLQCLQNVVQGWNVDLTREKNVNSSLLDDEFFRLLRQCYRSLVLFDSRHHIRHAVVSFWRESSELGSIESSPILDRYEKTVGFWRPMSSMRLDYFTVLRTLLLRSTDTGIARKRLEEEILKLNSMKETMSSVIEGEKLHWYNSYRTRFQKMICSEEEQSSKIVAPRHIEARNLVREVAPIISVEPCRRVVVVCMKATNLPNLSKSQTPYCKLQLRADELNRHYFYDDVKPQSDRCEVTSWASDPVSPVWNRMYMWDLQSSVASHTLFAEVRNSGLLYNTAIGRIDPMSLLNVLDNIKGAQEHFVNLKVPLFKGRGTKRRGVGFLHLRILIDMDGRTRAIDRMLNCVKRRTATISPGESERRRTVNSFKYLENEPEITKRHFSLPPQLSPEITSTSSEYTPPKMPLPMSLSALPSRRARSSSAASNAKASMLLGIEKGATVRSNEISDFVSTSPDEKKKEKNNAVAIWAFQSTHELETHVTIGTDTHGSDLGRVENGFGVSDVRNSNVHLTWVNHSRLSTAHVTCRSTMVRYEEWKREKEMDRRTFKTRLPFVWPPQIYVTQGHDRNTFRASMETVSSTTLLDVSSFSHTLRTYNALVHDKTQNSRSYRFNVKIDNLGQGGLRVGLCTSNYSLNESLGSSDNANVWSVAFTSRGACLSGGMFLRVDHGDDSIDTINNKKNDRFSGIEHRRAFEDHNRVVLKYNANYQMIQLEVNGRDVTSPMSLSNLWKSTHGNVDEMPEHLYFAVSMSPGSHVTVSGDSALFHVNFGDDQNEVESVVQSLVVSNVSNRRPVFTSSSKSILKGFDSEESNHPSVVVDGTLETSWFFRFDDDLAEYPYLSVELVKSCAIEAIDVLWGESRPNSYLIQISNQTKPSVHFGWICVADVDLRLVRRKSRWVHTSLPNVRSTLEQQISPTLNI